jgi:hypothetical protein
VVGAGDTLVGAGSALASLRWRAAPAIIPRPTVNLVFYHGVLAVHAHWRSQVVRHCRPAPDVNARACEASLRAAGTSGAWT